MEATKISAEDRKDIEILTLKIVNLDYQRKLMVQDMNKANEMIAKLQEELKQKSDELQQKYGVTLGRDTINPDGSFVLADTRQVANDGVVRQMAGAEEAKA